jgi:hypothetical protein
MKTKIFVSILLYLVAISFSWSQYSFDLSCLSDTHQIVAPNGVANFDFRLTNTGSLNDVYALDCQVIESIPGWFETFCLRGVCFEPGVIRYDTLNAGQFDSTIHITVYTNLTPGREILSLKVHSLADPNLKDSIRVYTQVGQGIEEIASLPLAMTSSVAIYPNPLKTQTAIRFTLKSFKTDIELKIYDVSGNLIKSFSTIPQSPATNHNLVWDGQDQEGQCLPPGSYIMTFIHNGKAIISKPMVLIK